jgi:hypothetical protein
LVPSWVISSATTCVSPARSIPSIITTASSSSDRPRESSSSSARRVRPTNADQHPLECDAFEQVARAELGVALELNLRTGVGRPHARAADRHPPPAERHLAGRMPVALGLPTGVVAAPRADDLVDLVLHALVQHREPAAEASASSPSFATSAISPSRNWTSSGSGTGVSADVPT